MINDYASLGRVSSSPRKRIGSGDSKKIGSALLKSCASTHAIFILRPKIFQALWFEEHIRAKVTNTLYNNNNKKIRVHVAIGTRSGTGKDKKSPIKSGPSVLPPFQIQFDTTDPLCTFEHFVALESQTRRLQPPLRSGEAYI